MPEIDIMQRREKAMDYIMRILSLAQMVAVNHANEQGFILHIDKFDSEEIEAHCSFKHPVR